MPRKKWQKPDLSKVEWQPCKNPFCATGHLVPKPMDFCSSVCSRQFNDDMLVCERYNLECPFVIMYGHGDKCIAMTQNQCKEWRDKGIIAPFLTENPEEKQTDLVDDYGFPKVKTTPFKIGPKKQDESHE